MINEQELAEAVDRLREGETVLGVNSDHVIDSIYSSPATTGKLLHMLHEHDYEAAKELFDSHFNLCGRVKLREAYRTKLEHEAGL